jgi:hypothetical protein
MFNTIVGTGAVGEGAGAGAASRYGSGSDQKMRLLAAPAPAPQHWFLNTELRITIAISFLNHYSTFSHAVFLQINYFGNFFHLELLTILPLSFLETPQNSDISKTHFKAC